MSDENTPKNDMNFWLIENLSDLPGTEKYYHISLEKNKIPVIPIFFSRKDAEIFFDQNFINPKRWNIQPLSLSYVITILLLAQKKNWELCIFYSYDPGEKGWGVKNISVSIRESYYKI